MDANGTSATGDGSAGADSKVWWGLDNLTTAGRVAWLWHGYLGAGAVTLLTGPWRTGLTTLAAVVLARLGTGGAVAGLPLSAGRARHPFQFELAELEGRTGG